MKKQISLLFALLAPIAVSGQKPQKLELTWGLENEDFYREVKPEVYDEEDEGQKAKPARQFNFREQKAIGAGMLHCFTEHTKLWHEYTKTHANPTKEEFEAFYKGQSPFCDGVANKIAPVLFFDFVSSSEEALVLQTIEVTTFFFGEYKGGGFAKQEAWYDVILSHKLGKKIYDLRKAEKARLTFTSSGRIQLRLWSDNYIPAMGWSSPRGEYVISIKFNFESRGRRVSAETGAFRIDV